MSNSKPNPTPTAGDRIRNIVERVERLEAEKASILIHIEDEYSEAISQGFDADTLRTIVGLRRLGKKRMRERQLVLDVYLQALGTE